MKTPVRQTNILPVLLIVLFCTPALPEAPLESYPWLKDYDPSCAIIKLISCPEGYRRVEVDHGSFAEWLRHLPIKEGQLADYVYDSKEVTAHDADYAIIDIDIGSANLQQCADAIIRLHAEYHYSLSDYSSISFLFTSGDTARFTDWIEGYRPKVKDNIVRWRKSADSALSYESFREYLDSVFMYAGTYSLSKQLTKVGSVDSVRIGDVLVLPGFPGHAVIVADMAVHDSSGRKLLMLLQGYTPAQDFHIIDNPTRGDQLPWFEMRRGDTLQLLKWTYSEKNLMRFK